MKPIHLFIFSLCIVLLISMVGGIVGHFVGLEQGFTSGLTAALVAVTAFYAYDTNRIRRSSEEATRAAVQQAKAAMQQAQAGVEQAKAAMQQAQTGAEQAKAAMQQAQTGAEQAKAAMQQAQAGLEMAKEIRLQRITREQPVVRPNVIRLESDYRDGKVIDIDFVTELTNIGNGPALDVKAYLGIEDDLASFKSICPPHEESYITAGETKNFRFEVNDRNGPFSGTSRLFGDYVLIIQWSVLYFDVGPFFEARMPIRVEMHAGVIRMLSENVRTQQKQELQLYQRLGDV